MKRRITAIFLVLLVVCWCATSVFAGGGIIRVELPKEMEGRTVYYSSAGEELKVVVGEDGIAEISNLEPGDYNIQIPNTDEYEFQNVEVRIPSWDEEENRMSYDITVQPKYQRNTRTPQTGDEAPIELYMGIGMVSFIGMIASAVNIKRSKKKI